MSAAAAALGVAACLSGGGTALFAAASGLQSAARRKRRRIAYGTQQPTLARSAGIPVSQLSLGYAKSLTTRLYAGSTQALNPRVRAGSASTSHAGTWFGKHARIAGCSKEISVAGFCEARVRLAAIGALAGALAGAVLSTELCILLGVAGAYALGTAPRRAVKSACKGRSVEAQKHLSEMLEVVALGLRSGLTFDRSFALYGSHFDNDFAHSCAKASRSWTLGLATREEALRDLAASYDCDQLARVVDGVVRGLRFGSSLTDLLEEAAAQSRANYRAALEERVAKAPVKMMLPTGTLILPAMLLLVMGPILLELAGGFS